MENINDEVEILSIVHTQAGNDNDIISRPSSNDVHTEQTKVSHTMINSKMIPTTSVELYLGDFEIVFKEKYWGIAKSEVYKYKLIGGGTYDT